MLASCSATASAKGFSPQSDPNRSVIHASCIFLAGLAAGLLSSFQTGCQVRPAFVVLATPSHLLPPSTSLRNPDTAYVSYRELEEGESKWQALTILSHPP